MASPLFSSIENDTLRAEEDHVWAEITGSISPQHRKRSIDDLTMDSFASLVSSPSSSFGSEQVCREVSTTTDDSSLLIETNVNKRQTKDHAKGGNISHKQPSTQRQRQTRLTIVKQELTYPNDDPKGKLSQRIKSTVDNIVSQNGLDITMHPDDDCPGKSPDARTRMTITGPQKSVSDASILIMNAVQKMPSCKEGKLHDMTDETGGRNCTGNGKAEKAACDDVAISKTTNDEASLLDLAPSCQEAVCRHDQESPNQVARKRPSTEMPICAPQGDIKAKAGTGATMGEVGGPQCPSDTASSTHHNQQYDGNIPRSPSGAADNGYLSKGHADSSVAAAATSRQPNRFAGPPLEDRVMDQINSYQFKAKVGCPSRLAGRLIGYRGSRIRDIMTATNCKIFLPRSQQENGKNGETFSIICIGASAQSDLNSAVELVNQAIESFRDGRHVSFSSGQRHHHKPTAAGESCTIARGKTLRPRYHQQQPPHGPLPLDYQQHQPAYPAGGTTGPPPAHPSHHMMMPPWWTPEMLQVPWHYYEHPAYHSGPAPPPGYWGHPMMPPGASANQRFWTAATAHQHQQPLAAHQPPPPPPSPPALPPSLPTSSKDDPDSKGS